ncbi:hypothetical protein C8R48DRAFT_678982 [Suillus tomentosus]|nr:hypothetical protein C8R48DRAFT_678982 [Suillus tomentosus]
MIASIDDVIGGDVDKKMDAFSRSLDFFLINPIMAPFNITMLNSTPSPEPEPVAQGAPEDASMADASVESDTNRLFSTWAASLVALEACVMAAPDLKPELLEDQEMWLREWRSVLGRKTCKDVEAVVKGWKVKAVETVPEAPPKQAARATRMPDVEARATDASGTDAGKQLHYSTKS